MHIAKGYHAINASGIMISIKTETIKNKLNQNSGAIKNKMYKMVA